MRIINIFPYYLEKDILELRIEMLNSIVDAFIICDGDRELNGKPKPFLLKEHLAELNLDVSKITAVEVQLPSVEESSFSISRQRHQINAATDFIEDDDIVIYNQSNSIINPDLIHYFTNIAKQNPDRIVRIPVVQLAKRADQRICEDYNSDSFICLKHHLTKYTISEIREKRNTLYPDIFITQGDAVLAAGWSFSPSSNFLDTMSYPVTYLPNKLFELPRVKKSLLPDITWKQIDGFFEYASFYQMCFNFLPSPSTLVEIGSWKGRSSCYMASLIKESGVESTFYCVDTWEGSEEHKSLIQELKDKGTTLFDEFLKNVKLCQLDDYIIAVKKDSVEAAKLFEDESIDFIHIDASHDYDNVMKDLKAWYPKVKKGALITGDDYGWDGVQRAVNDFFVNEDILWYDHDNKNGAVWFCQKI